MAYIDEVMADAPTSWWRLGESGGTSLDDEITTNNGSVVGSVSFSQAGATFDSSKAIATPGTTGNELTFPAPMLSTTGTIEFWAKWVGGTGVAALMRDHTGGGGWILGYDSSGSFAWRIAGTSRVTGTTVASLRDGNFHHYVFTKNGVNGSVYIDGDLIDSGTAFANTASLTPWHLGRNGSQPTEYTQATYDELAIYPTELTQARVTAHFEAA